MENSFGNIQIVVVTVMCLIYNTRNITMHTIPAQILIKYVRNKYWLWSLSRGKRMYQWIWLLFGQSGFAQDKCYCACIYFSLLFILMTFIRLPMCCILTEPIHSPTSGIFWWIIDTLRKPLKWGWATWQWRNINSSDRRWMGKRTQFYYLWSHLNIKSSFHA